MRGLNRTAALGGVISGLALVVFVIYELVLYPAAGFPTNDYAVIVEGANTLRIAHLLKFAYAIGLTLVLVGLYPRASASWAIPAQLGAVSGIAAAIFMLGSGMLGLRILQVAEDTFVTKPEEAIATILLRSVTVAMFEAGIFASGLFALLISLALMRSREIPSWIAYTGMVLGVLFVLDRVLFYPLNIVSAFVAILWSFSLAVALTRTRVETGDSLTPSVAATK